MKSCVGVTQFVSFSNQKTQKTVYASFITDAYREQHVAPDRREAAARSCSAPPSLIGRGGGTAFGLFVSTKNLLLLLLLLVYNSRSVLLIVEAFS